MLHSQISSLSPYEEIVYYKNSVLHLYAECFKYIVSLYTYPFAITVIEFSFPYCNSPEPTTTAASVVVHQQIVVHLAFPSLIILCVLFQVWAFASFLVFMFCLVLALYFLDLSACLLIKVTL